MYFCPCVSEFGDSKIDSRKSLVLTDYLHDLGSTAGGSRKTGDCNTYAPHNSARFHSERFGKRSERCKQTVVIKAFNAGKSFLCGEKNGLYYRKIGDLVFLVIEELGLVLGKRNEDVSNVS